MRGRELSVNIGQLEHVVEVIRFSSFALAATPRFQFVEPTLNGFLSFLRNGGVVFIRKGGSIPKGVAGICEVDLQDRDSFAIPFFLVCKVGCPPETVEPMIAFFREKLG